MASSLASACTRSSLTTALETYLLCDERKQPIANTDETKRKMKRKRRICQPRPRPVIVPVVKRPSASRVESSPEEEIEEKEEEEEEEKATKADKAPRKKKQATLLPGYYMANKKKKKEKDVQLKSVTTTMADFFQPRPLKLGADGKPLPKCVPRYGRIYKRKPGDRIREKDCGQLKVAPGMRLCRMCKCLQPLEKFYSNVKRYICKYHHYQMVLGRKQVRFEGCAYESVAWDCWVALHELCPLLGYSHVNYDRHDIMDLMMKTEIPTFCRPRAIPIDPRIPMRPRNVAIVTEANFILIVHVLRQTLSVAQFVLLVQACNLLPENADVGTPWAPFQDASYRRAEIDVAPILEAERTCPQKERLSKDAVQYVQENAQLIRDLKRGHMRYLKIDRDIYEQNRQKKKSMLKQEEEAAATAKTSASYIKK